MVISLNGRLEVAAMPGGVVGQMSFRRLNEVLRQAGELRDGEIVTHIEIKIRDGLIRYRVDTEVA